MEAKTPLIVTEQFIKYAIDYNSESSGGWKAALPLLGVCHEWRKLALPLVYKNLYFVGASENGSGMNSSLSDRCTHTTAGKTNIGLVKHTNNTHLVKSLNITLVYSQYFYKLVDDMQMLFEFDNFGWTNITDIRICLTPYGEEGDLMDDEQTQNNLYQTIIRFAHILHEAMPRVVNVQLSIEPRFLPGRLLGNQVAAVYAHQLKSLKANRFPVSTELQFSTALSSLDIMLSDQHLISTVYVDCLQDLKLRNVPDGFTWQCFINTEIVNNVSSVRFSQLRKLALHFANTDANPQQIDGILTDQQELLLANTSGVHGTRKYEFPKLTSLYVFVGSFGVLQNTFCTTAYQWPNIQSLEIEGYGDMDLLMGNDDPVVLNQNIQTLTQSVAMQMPLINKIRMSGFIESEESSMLLSNLVKQYSDNLKNFYTCYPVQMEPYRKLEKLEKLVINSSLGYSLDFVRSCAGSLRHLELDNLAHGFSWSAFSNHETNGCIRFSRLEQFNIIYNTNVVDFHSDYQYFAYRHIYEITEIPAECPRLRKIYMGNASYCSLQNVLCFGSSPWDSVDTLEIELANFENIHNVDVHLPVFHSCLKHFAQQIVQAIPNVKSLYCGGDRTNPAENMLYVTLISGYFDQLNRLLSTTLVVPTIFENKNKFKSLDLVFSGSQHVISNPKICVNDLDKLQLTNVPADFSWSWFTDARGLTDISFDSLTNFSLDLNASAASDSGIQRMETDDMQQKQMYICLPKITSIIIKAKDPNNDLASSSLVIQNAGSIALKGPVGAMPRCANSLTYSVANYLDIDVSAAGSNDENQFYLVTNSWLQSKSFINRSWLKINNLGFSLDASLVRWNSLCSLDICCDIAFGTLVDLLSRLVCLDTLHVDRLYAAEMIPAISTIEAVVYTCALIAPVSTSVKSLEISGFADGCVSHVLAASIKYLLLVIPSLDKMYVPEEVAFSIDSFVKQLGHTYPHLGSITFN